MNVLSLKKIAGIAVTGIDTTKSLFEKNEAKKPEKHMFSLLVDRLTESKCSNPKRLAEFIVWKKILKDGITLTEDNIKAMADSQHQANFMSRMGGLGGERKDVSAKLLMGNAYTELCNEDSNNVLKVLDIIVEHYQDVRTLLSLSEKELELIDTAEVDLVKSGILIEKFDFTELEALSPKEPVAKNAPVISKGIIKEGEQIAHAKSWLKEHKDHSKQEFIHYATSTLGLKATQAGSAFHMIKEGINETFVLSHPNYASQMLHENKELNTYEWVDHSSHKIPMMFDAEESANKIAKYLSEWKGQASQVKVMQIT